MRFLPTIILAVLLISWSGKGLVMAQLIVAHRGASADAPENTLAAFRLAWQQKADAIEGDFYLTADQQIVAIHDQNTKRTTGVELDVCQVEANQLLDLDAGTWKGPGFAGECIPTLQQVIASIPNDRIFVLEIKDKPRMVPVLAAELKSNPAFAEMVPDRLKIISFNADVIKACKQQMPQVTALWLTGFKKDKVTGEISPTIQSILQTLEDCQADGLDCNASLHIDQEFVDQLRNANPANPYEFHVWTVDDPQVARHFQKLDVDSITTNKPAFLRKALKESEPSASATED